jgi:hypothetical protein
VRLAITLPEGGAATLHKGGVAPICGWVSRSFDRRVPAPTIAWRARLAGRTILRTEMKVEFDAG